MFDFPNSPTIGQTIAGANGAYYMWDGVKWEGITAPTAIGEAPADGTSYARRNHAWTPTYAGSPLTVSVLDHGAMGDGVTDDTSAIQTTLSNYAGKAVVVVPNTGHPYMVQPLNLPSGTDLLVYGTIMGQKGAANGVLVIQGGATGVTVRGTGTIDGNDAPGSAGAVAGIMVANAANVQIRDITVQNAHSWNLNVVASNHVLADHVNLLGGGNGSNEFAQGSNDCWLMNSHIVGPSDGAFAFYGGVTNSGAIGNTVTNPNSGQPGFNVVSDPGQPAPCTGIVIANNVVHDCGAGAIQVIAVGVSGDHSQIIITGNECYNNCKSANVPGAPPNCDIFLASCYYSMVTGNVLRGCQNGGHGIVLSGGSYGPCAGITIAGNNISEEGQGTAAGIGINIAGTANYITIRDNHIYDFQSTPTMAYGISGSCGNNTVITNNTLSVATPTNITPASDTILFNSVPGGTIAMPHGALTVSAPIGLTTPANVARWFIGNAGNTESGGNSGSDFEIVNAADSGSVLSQVLLIKRSSGLTTFNLGVQFASTVGFNNTAPVAKPTVTGAKGGNAALASLLTALASYGLVTDSSGA